MGSTFVSFRECGFEASDGAVEIWLLLLVDAIDQMTRPPEWLEEAREEWHLQATAGFGFGVMPGLDQIVTSSVRRDLVLQLCETAMKRLADHGSLIRKEELNSIIGGNDRSMFTEDGRTEDFAKVGEYFIKLLREELRPEESDARRYSMPET